MDASERDLEEYKSLASAAQAKAVSEEKRAGESKLASALMTDEHMERETTHKYKNHDK